MRVFAQLNIPEPPKDVARVQDLFVWADKLHSALHRLFDEFESAVNGEITFGDGVDVDNMCVVPITYTSNGAANTEDVLDHDQGRIPVGILVVDKDKAANWYKGATAWSTTQISLKWDVASVTATLFVLFGPRT